MTLPMRTVNFITLDAFADAMGFDADVVRDTLSQRGVTFGGSRGERVFLTAGRLCLLCEYPSMPEGLEPDDYILIDG